MKNKLFVYVPLLLMLFSFSFLYGQKDGDMPLMYSIHHDPVKPSMVDEYEKLAKEFVAFLKENDVQDFDYTASVSEEFNYYYISTVNKMADFDKSPMQGLSEEAQEKLTSIFDKMDECYNRHGSYMLYLDTTLTYMPNGFSASTPGQPYRTYLRHHYEPSNAEEIYNTFKSIRELFEKNKPDFQYRIYHSGFGLVDNYILVAISAKDPIDHSTRNRAMWETMGEEFSAAVQQLLKYTSKYEVERAWMREDLGYQYKK